MYVLITEKNVSNLPEIEFIGRSDSVDQNAVHVGFFIPNTNKFYVHCSLLDKNYYNSTALNEAQSCVSFLNGGA